MGNKSSSNKNADIELLIIGCSSTGKTSLFKQVKQLYSKFSEEEMRCYSTFIYDYILSSMNSVLMYCIENKIPFENEENKQAAINLCYVHEELSPQRKEYCQRLWNDKNVQKVFEVACKVNHCEDGIY